MLFRRQVRSGPRRLGMSLASGKEPEEVVAVTVGLEAVA